METKLSYQNFTELSVWKESRAFKLEIYQLVKNFPVEEKYRLSDQLIRAARSICSNIAEGHGRFTFKDQLHFCIQARGSLSEIWNHLIDALDMGFVGQEKLDLLHNSYNELGKLLNGYITYLRNQVKS